MPVPPVPHQEMPASFEPPKLVRRFHAKGKTEIWESIQYMDHEGIELLRRPGEFGAREKWEGYLDETQVSRVRSKHTRTFGEHSN